MNTACHVAGIAKIRQSYFAILSVSLFLNLNLAKLLVNTCTALRLMEALISDPTSLVAVAYPLTLTLDCEQLGLTTVFALSYKTAFLDVKFVLKIGGADFDQNDFVLPLFLLERVNSAYHRFQAFPWKFYPRVFFNRFGFGS